MGRLYNRYNFGQHAVWGEKKERLNRRKTIAFLSLFALSCLFSLLLLRSPYFAIETICVQGLKNLPQEEIISVMGIREGTSIWEVSPPELEKRILSLPAVKLVRVERLLPRTLEIYLEEKYPVALVPYQHYYLEVSAAGNFIGVRSQVEGDLPVINGLSWGKMEVGREIPDPVKKEILVAILQEIGTLSYPVISEINIHDAEQIVLYTLDGLEVLLGKGEEISRKMEVLGKLYFHLDQELFTSGYLDLRVVEAPVFKPVQNNLDP